MARPCTVCNRPDAGEINQMLVAGRSSRSVAVEVGISDDAMQAHRRNHLGRRPTTRASSSVARAHDDGPHEHGDPLDELVVALRDQALAGHNPALVHQYRLALAAQQAAAHAAAPVRDLAAEPEWIAVRTAVLRALEPFPEARLAVALALAELG